MLLKWMRQKLRKSTIGRYRFKDSLQRTLFKSRQPLKPLSERLSAHVAPFY
jgi:hypothetical protein